MTAMNANKYLLLVSSAGDTGAGTEPVVRLDGKEFLLFSSNNILGMSFHPEVKAAALQALADEGLLALVDLPHRALQ